MQRILKKWTASYDFAMMLVNVLPMRDTWDESNIRILIEEKSIFLKLTVPRVNLNRILTISWVHAISH